MEILNTYTGSRDLGGDEPRPERDNNPTDPNGCKI